MLPFTSFPATAITAPSCVSAKWNCPSVRVAFFPALVSSLFAFTTSFPLVSYVLTNVFLSVSAFLNSYVLPVTSSPSAVPKCSVSAPVAVSFTAWIVTPYGAVSFVTPAYVSDFSVRLNLYSPALLIDTALSNVIFPSLSLVPLSVTPAPVSVNLNTRLPSAISFPSDPTSDFVALKPSVTGLVFVMVVFLVLLSLSIVPFALLS